MEETTRFRTYVLSTFVGELYTKSGKLLRAIHRSVAMKLMAAWSEMVTMGHSRAVLAKRAHKWRKWVGNWSGIDLDEGRERGQCMSVGKGLWERISEAVS